MSYNTAMNFETMANINAHSLHQTSHDIRMFAPKIHAM